MKTKSKIQINLNNTYFKKSRKIISILVVFLLISTIVSSVVSSRGFLSDSIKKDAEDESGNSIKSLLKGGSIKERLLQVKYKIRSLIDRISQIKDRSSKVIKDGTDTNKDTPQSNPRILPRFSFVDALRRYLRFRGAAQNSLFVFYTNYSGIEKRNDLKLFQFVNIDVNGDGKDDISVKVLLYPYIEEEFCLSINFEYLIKRLPDFPDIYASFEAYTELYFPGILIKKQKGDRIRFGYESPEGEEVPSKCDITYKYLPHLLSLRKRPEHRARLDPGSSIGNSKLVLLLSYTNFEGENVVSELRSKIIYNPAVRSEVTIGGDGILGGSTFEFVREVSEESKIDMTCAFEKNNTLILGYVKDLPEKVTFTIDHGREGFAEFDTHGQPPTEIGLCDDFDNPVNYIYFKDLPSKARLEWTRHLLTQKKANISFYTNGSGISLLGHIEFRNNGTFDFNVSSRENLDCALSIDGSEGYVALERSAVNISFSLSVARVNNSFNLSFNMTRFYDKPFEIFFGKLINEEIKFSLASKSFTLEDFYMLIGLQMGEIGIKASKIVKEKNGSITVNISYLKDEGNLTVRCEVYVINGINIYNFSLGFNGLWSAPQDIILIGNASYIFEFFCEVSEFEYYIADDWSWGYFYFRGNISYATYRLFTINNVTGGVKGKIFVKSGSDGLNISWYTENKSGYNVRKINVSGLFFGLEDFHLFYGDMIDFSIPYLYGNILLKEVCNESGYFYIELQGGQSYLDINFSFNFTHETNMSITELIVKVEDFHIDHGDRSAFFEVIWGNKNLSSLVFYSENNINLSIGNMYIIFGDPNFPLFGIENLTGYLKGYAGFDVNITMPVNSSFTNETKYLDLSNETFAFNLTDVELDLRVRNLIALLPLGRIAIAANATGNVKLSLVNVSMITSILYEEVNFTWLNVTFGIDARNGELNLNYFEFEHFEIILLLLLPSLELDFLIPFIATTLVFENLTINGYSALTIPMGMFETNIFPTYLGFRIDNEEDTQITMDKLYVYFPEIPIFEEYMTLFIDNVKLGEGAFEFILGFFIFSIEIPEGDALQSIGLGLELPNYIRFNLSTEQPIEYFKFDINLGFNEEEKEYILLDTHNSTMTFDMCAVVTSEFINNTVEVINNMTNFTFPYVENDKGVRVDNVTLQADFFRVYLNFSSRPLYKGYLRIYGDGSIYHLVNGTWEPLLPGGEGYSFIIEEGHIQIKFDMAFEDLPIDFEMIFDNTGDKIILSGLFSVYSDNLTFDIWWDLEEGYIDIITNMNHSLEIEDFVFKFINDSVNKIDIQTDLISLANGSFSMTFDMNDEIFELQYGGSILSVEGFDSEFNEVPLKNIGNSTITLDFDSLTILGGVAIFQTVLGSEEYNWSIESQRGIDWFELTGLNGSIEGIDKPLIHFEAGIGLLKWNRSSNNFLRLNISRSTGEGSIKIDRHSDLDGSLVIQDAYIRYITPTLKIPIGTRLRSLTAEYQRNDHEYIYLNWKKGEYIDLTADIDASWDIEFERFFDIFNYISRIDLVSSSVDVNFSLHYEPPADNFTAHHLDLNILEESSIELLEIVNHYALRFDKILTIGSLQLQPGEISFDWLIDKDEGAGWINIDNTGVTGEFTGLSLRKGFKQISLLDVSIIDPGETYLDFELNNDSGSLYLYNTAELEFTLLEFSRGIDAFRIERDIEFGIITMLPGEFNADWINLTSGDYDKEFIINNGVFELTFARLTLQLGNLKISLSLFKTDRIYENDITVKLRQRGQGNRGFCITTDDPLQFDLLSIKISSTNWELIIDLVELKANFSEWYLGTWDGKITIGGGGTVKFAGLSRFINITFRWKGEDGQEQELFAQYCGSWENDPQTHAFILDTNNCTETLEIDYSTEISNLNIDSQLMIYPQKDFIMHFDMNPEPIDGTIDGHIYVDTDDEEIGNLAIEVTKHVDYFDVDVGLYAEIELLKADEFHIWGEFTYTKIGNFWFWIPTDWGKSGSIDFVNVGVIKLIFGSQETEVWPCTPKAVLDKNQYGVTPEGPIVTFDTSGSEGFVFKVQWMRWDWDGDGDWDTGTGPNHWVDYPDDEIVEHDFSDMFNGEPDSVQVRFQVKTWAAESNIAVATVIKGYALDVSIQYDGDKLYEFEPFTVVVKNATTGTPVSNALVTYHQWNQDGTEDETTNYTNSNGKAGFIAFSVPYDYYVHYSDAKAYVEADGYFDGESGWFGIHDTDADLHGYIRDIVTHWGIPNALIVAEPGGYSTYSEDYPGNNAPQDGKFKLMVPPGIYDITASKSGYESTTIEDVNAIQGGYQYLGDIYLPPLNYGGIHGFVYDATDDGDPIRGVTVTVIIPGGDDLVSTTYLNGEFPDDYPEPVDYYYAFKVSPGTYAVTFSKDDYYFYSEDVTVVAGEVEEMEVYLYQKWKTPTGHNYSSEWHDEEDAHDDKLNTAAYTDLCWDTDWRWTEPLVLKLSSPLTCDRIRFYAKQKPDRLNKVKIEIYYDNDWREVYTGGYIDREWVTKEFDTEHTISKARISFKLRWYFIPTFVDLHEFDFGVAPP